MQFHCISLTFAFAFDDFKSLLWNFSLNWNDSKFGNFRLGNAESWNSQYRNYLYAIKHFFRSILATFWVKKEKIFFLIFVSFLSRNFSKNVDDDLIGRNPSKQNHLIGCQLSGPKLSLKFLQDLGSMLWNFLRP